MSDSAHLDVLQFWFGQLDEQGLPEQDVQKKWFVSSSDFDTQIKQQFGDLVNQALNGKLASWNQTAYSCAAHIILLDQFSRNIYRGSAKAFSGDPIAIQATKDCLSKLTSDFYKLPTAMRFFVYMPLMHSELLSDHKLLMAYYVKETAQNQSESVMELWESAQKSAIEHGHILQEFGRYPHRNKVLSRLSTEQEKQYLESGANRFGQ